MAEKSGIIKSNNAWFQKKVLLRPAKRGCHLITDELFKNMPELKQFSIGLCHIHIQHTSASLTLNENWDPDVREDMEMMLNKLVPENANFLHCSEGSEDGPSHVKSSLLGSSLTIPITDGSLSLGTWQGIWLNEHRNKAGSRKVIITLNGTTKE